MFLLVFWMRKLLDSAGDFCNYLIHLFSLFIYKCKGLFKCFKGILLHSDTAASSGSCKLVGCISMTVQQIPEVHIGLGSCDSGAHTKTRCNDLCNHEKMLCWCNRWMCNVESKWSSVDGEVAKVYLNLNSSLTFLLIADGTSNWCGPLLPSAYLPLVMALGPQW